MKLLLHACCADCALKFIASIKEDKNITELVFYYYNPNIHPRSEYQSRLKAIQQVALENKIKIIVPDWKPGDYFMRINPSKSPFDKGDLSKPKRCIVCWNLRLEETVQFAKENNFDMFASTLVTSQYQDSETIKGIAKNLAKKYNVDFYVPARVCTDLKTSGFYKQSFCGCTYSLTEKMEEKHKVI